jgi:hypothetical protein
MATEREYFFTDEWFPKIIERGSVVLDCIRNKTEIQESDWEVVKELHRIWSNGILAWTKPKEAKNVEKAEQIGLFADNQAVKVEEIVKIDAHDDLGTAIVPPKVIKPKRKRR